MNDFPKLQKRIVGFVDGCDASSTVSSRDAMRDDARCVRYTPGSSCLLYASDTDACTRPSVRIG